MGDLHLGDVHLGLVDSLASKSLLSKSTTVRIPGASGVVVMRWLEPSIWRLFTKRGCLCKKIGTGTRKKVANM